MSKKMSKELKKILGSAKKKAAVPGKTSDGTTYRSDLSKSQINKTKRDGLLFLYSKKCIVQVDSANSLDGVIEFAPNKRAIAATISVNAVCSGVNPPSPISTLILWANIVEFTPEKVRVQINNVLQTEETLMWGYVEAVVSFYRKP